jgi:hypothetical protein
MTGSVTFNLISANRQARLKALRDGVAPIFRNRLHRHFTDHSIEHCDRVADLCERLLAPLVRKLSDEEGAVMYGVAYLHDIGMHNEKAGESGRLAKTLHNEGRDWAKIAFEDRLDIIRRNHHEISADMVIDSVRSGTPPINFTLGDDDRPAEIAAICEAHCVDTAAARYDRLVPKPERPTMRLRLLAAILRLADILDEAHHRALVAQAHTLDLNLESRMHWWRHYYTREVEIDLVKNRVTIVFGFPAGKSDQYSKLIPALQMPWVEQEFDRHRAILAENGLSWHLSWVVQETPFDTLEQMPLEVESYMLQQLARRKQLAATQSRIDLLSHFDASRADLLTQLRAVEATSTTAEPAKYLRQILRITLDLWELGSHLTARARLGSALFFATSNGRTVDSALQVHAATELAKMEEQQNPRGSVTGLLSVQKLAEGLPDDASEKTAFYRTLATLARRAGAFAEGNAAAKVAIRLFGNSAESENIRAEVAEAFRAGHQHVGCDHAAIVAHVALFALGPREAIWFPRRIAPSTSDKSGAVNGVAGNALLATRTNRV